MHARLTGALARRCPRMVAAAVALTAALLSAWAAPALASTSQSSILMDDNQLIYMSSTSHLEQSLARIRSLGFDVIRVSVVWSLVAPDATSRTAPKFDATNPNAYPAGAWDRYDRLAELAPKFGLKVYFQLTAPAPKWATTPGYVAPETHPWSRLPHAGQYGQFAEAVGKRYSGSFVPPGGASSPPITVPLSPLAIPPQPSVQPSTPGALPAVRWWSFWNEPNDPGWLSPQYHRMYGQKAAWSPWQDRNLVDDGYSGLIKTGHRHDTILIGEMSTGRGVNILAFMRDLYCLSGKFRPLTGVSAKRLGCPTSGNRGSFVAGHPALFHASGFAAHPYLWKYPPNRPDGRQVMTIRNLGVERGLFANLYRGYRQRGSLPIYITEWGYKTKPPNPFSSTSLLDQEVWINQGEYMTWHMSFVRSIAQFELVDDKPRTQYRRGSQQYWSTFQTGLMFADGKPKPSYGSFRMPIWVAWPHPGRSVAVWGSLRPANHSSVQTGQLQFRGSSHSKWTTIRTFRTRNSQGYYVERVRIRRTGAIRVGWKNPANGVTVYSRQVPIRR